MRNLDFDVPKALQKRPGSTFGIGSSNGTSGPIQTIYEFSKLTGESYIVTASDTALFYVAANAYTLLASGWNNGQPPDMLTFVNKLWIANGQKYGWWSGTSFFSAGLPVSPTTLDWDHRSLSQQGVTWALAGGVTWLISNGNSYVTRGIYVAYSYLRVDGYEGPANFLRDARNVLADPSFIQTNGGEIFNSFTTIAGFTALAGRGITAIKIWVASDTLTDASATDPDVSAKAGNLGYRVLAGNPQFYAMSYTLKPSADLSRFGLYQTVPITSLFAKITDTILGTGITQWCSTFSPGFSVFASVAVSPSGFSGMLYDISQTSTPKYIEINQNSMFYAGFSNQPSVVQFSEVGEPEVILPESFFEVRTNDGDKVLGIQSFNNYLLVMKEKSFHKLIGDTADNYQLVQLSTDYGCLSQRSIVTIDQSAYWLDKKGILQFTGANWSIISGAIEGVFRRMNISAALEKATAVHHIYRNQIWFGIPVDGSTVNNLTIVYDYLVQAWTFFDGYNASSYAYIKGALDRPTAWRGDYSGMIHYTGESFMSDSGRGISCLALTHFENEGGENQTTIWRRFFLDVATVSGASAPINGQVFSNYNTSTVQATFQMFQGQFQTRAEMGVVGKAVAAQVAQFSTNTPLLINGYSWAKRGLRNV